jgi:hypothetical protein
MKNTKEQRGETHCATPRPHAVGTDVPRPRPVCVLKVLAADYVDKPVVLGGEFPFLVSSLR